MSSSSKKITKKLLRAKGRGRVVRLWRSGLDDVGYVEGFVLSVGRKWILIEYVSDNVHPDGHELVRRKHVTKVSGRGSAMNAYISRAVTEMDRSDLGVFVSPKARTREVIAAVSKADPLIGVHLEAEDGDLIFIGRLERLDAESFDLRQITPTGQWEDVPSTFRYADITRVTIGDRYMQGLARYGNPYVEPVEASDPADTDTDAADTDPSVEVVA